MNIYFLFFFIGLSLESIYKLPKYGSISWSPNKYVYLELSDYSKGDTIYLEVTFYSDSPSEYNYFGYIYYLEYNSLDETYIKKENFLDIYYDSYSRTRTSSYSYNYYYFYTFYYEIKLDTNNDYLILKTDQSKTELRIRHAKTSHWKTIIIVVSVIIVILLISLGIYFIIRKRIFRVRTSVINQPLVTNVEPIYTPPPGFDPNYVQPYYSTY